ncbi:MAG TPA: I78 family peptidase inhibitor [Allosphingosinicella sp.]
MTRLIGGALLMAMTGCANLPPPNAEEVPVRGDSGRKCDASKAQGLVGRKASQELGEAALRLSGAGALRWIPEGGIVTMDFREDRLNLRLDGQNKVVAISCG